MEVPNQDAVPSLHRLFKGHLGEVTSLSFNPGQTQLASSSLDSSVMLWNFNKKVRAIKFSEHSDSIMGVHYSQDGRLLASCSKDKSVCLRTPSIKPRSRTFRAHTSAVRSICFSSDSASLLTASNDKSIKLWMTEYENKFLSSFTGHTNWVKCARFSKTRHLVVSCSEDKTVKLWDKLSNICTHTYPEQDGLPNYVEFHPNEKCISVCYSNNIIKIYDIRNHQLLQHYSVHNQSVNQISFHPCGKFLISGSSDATIKVFDLVEGRVTYTLEGHKGAVTTVTFSCDGQYFASGDAGKTVMVWKTNFDREVLAMPLDTFSASEDISTDVEQRTQKVDARLSFDKMPPQLDVEESSTYTTDSNLLDDEKSNKVSKADNSNGNQFFSGSSHSGSLESLGNNDQITVSKDVLNNLKKDLRSIESMLLNAKNVLAKIQSASRHPNH